MLSFARSALARRGMSTAAAAAAGPSGLPPAALGALETRWFKLPTAEKGAIADALAVVQRGDWRKMSVAEKRAGGW